MTRLPARVARLEQAARARRLRDDDDGTRADLLRVAADLRAGRVTLTPEQHEALDRGLAAIEDEIRKDNPR